MLSTEVLNVILSIILISVVLLLLEELTLTDLNEKFLYIWIPKTAPTIFIQFSFGVFKENVCLGTKNKYDQFIQIL